jgi:hypothetical protein
MNFEIYCDESGLEALTRKDAHPYSAIGGIWMPATYRSKFKEVIADIKKNHNVYGEIKWQKVSPAFIELYSDIIRYFFATNELRFRVIIVESNIVDHVRFNDMDSELGFYKFYYQLLHHWILDFNKYDIFLDHKLNRDKGRLSTLKEVLDASNLTSDIEQVQALPSNESVGIQIADILTGLTAAKFNDNLQSSAKKQLIRLVEENIGHPVRPTSKVVEKFNVFKINLQGGW